MQIPENLAIMIYSLTGSSDLVRKWWTSQNLAFEGMTPQEMYKINPRKVEGYLEWHCFG